MKTEISRTPVALVRRAGLRVEVGAEIIFEPLVDGGPVLLEVPITLPFEGLLTGSRIRMIF